MSLSKQTARVEFDPTKSHQCLRLVNIPKCIALSIFNSRERFARCGLSFTIPRDFYCRGLRVTKRHIKAETARADFISTIRYQSLTIIVMAFYGSNALLVMLC